MELYRHLFENSSNCFGLVSSVQRRLGLRTCLRVAVTRVNGWGLAGKQKE